MNFIAALLLLCTPAFAGQHATTGWMVTPDTSVTIPLGIEVCEGAIVDVTVEQRFALTVHATVDAPNGYQLGSGLTWDTQHGIPSDYSGPRVYGQECLNVCGGAIYAGQTHTVRVNTGPIPFHYEGVAMGNELQVGAYWSMQEWNGIPTSGHQYWGQWWLQREYCRFTVDVQ